MTPQETAEAINLGTPPEDVIAGNARKVRDTLLDLGVLRRDGEVTAAEPARFVKGGAGDLLLAVLDFHPDPCPTLGERSTRQWAYELRKAGWPVRYTKRVNGYYLAVPVEKDWRMPC